MMKIIIFILVIILILVLILPNKKPITQNNSSGCGCTESYDNSSPQSKTHPKTHPKIHPIIQYIIQDSTTIDIFSIYSDLKTFGWNFTALTQTATYKQKSSSDTTEHIYGKLATKQLDASYNIMYDNSGNSILSDETYTKIGKNLSSYITNNKVPFSSVRLFDEATDTFIYVNPINPDIASLVITLDIYKKELYTNFIHN